MLLFVKLLKKDVAGGILDDDIYAELEMQRDALLNLHRKQVEADEEKKKDASNRQQGFA